MLSIAPYLLLLASGGVHSFQLSSPVGRRSASASKFSLRSSTTAPSDVAATATASTSPGDLLKRDRYVATNRECEYTGLLIYMRDGASCCLFFLICKTQLHPQ